MPTKIIFLVPYPLDESPSQRFRFEQYFTALEEKGYTFRVYSFLSVEGWKDLYSKKALKKVWHLLKGFLRRLFHLFYTSSSDYVFIHREVTPVGPPVFEWVIANIFRKKIIYDFDDAIWLTDKTETPLMRLIRWRSKVRSVCRWSYKVSCGNSYLMDFAARFNSNMVLNPTTIDINLHQPALKKTDSQKITIGWTGSHSTLKYLHSIENVLEQIEKKFREVSFIVIANKTPLLKLERLEFIEWNKKTEIEDLLCLDIGIMPLPDDDWSKGKCGFKALQYMALEIPCVISPVGVNVEIIEHGTSGYLASSTEEWIEYLTKLIFNPDLRKKIGAAGRRKVIQHYSVSSNTSNFLGLFE